MSEQNEVPAVPSAAEIQQAILAVQLQRAEIEAKQQREKDRADRLDALMKTGSVAELLAEATPDEILTLARKDAHDKNRASQSSLPMPSQPEEDWAARNAWLGDGQPIYGVLNEFCWAATDARLANDQAEYERQMDLIYKAIRTQCGDRPPKIELPEPEPET